MNKLTIKSVGFIDGKYTIILSDGSELENVRYMNLSKSSDSIGKLIVEIVLPTVDIFKND